MEHYIAYEGKKVALAAMNREYLPKLMQHVNDLEATQGTRMIPPYTLEHETAWYERIAVNQPDQQYFAILQKKVGTSPKEDKYEYIGHTALFGIQWPDGTGTTMSLIFRKDLHGKGLGTEAKLLLLRHAFLQMGLRKVCSKVKAFNGNSLGHLMRCGYRVVGVQRSHVFHQGSYVDFLTLEVFREAFENIWEEYEETGKLPPLNEEQKANIQKITGSNHQRADIEKIISAA